MSCSGDPINTPPSIKASLPSSTSSIVTPPLPMVPTSPRPFVPKAGLHLTDDLCLTRRGQSSFAQQLQGSRIHSASTLLQNDHFISKMAEGAAVEAKVDS